MLPPQAAPDRSTGIHCPGGNAAEAAALRAFRRAAMQPQQLHFVPSGRASAAVRRFVLRGRRPLLHWGAKVLDEAFGNLLPGFPPLQPLIDMPERINVHILMISPVCDKTRQEAPPVLTVGDEPPKLRHQTSAFGVPLQHHGVFPRITDGIEHIPHALHGLCLCVSVTFCCWMLCVLCRLRLFVVSLFFVIDILVLCGGLQYAVSVSDSLLTLCLGGWPAS